MMPQRAGHVKFIARRIVIGRDAVADCALAASASTRGSTSIPSLPRMSVKNVSSSSSDRRGC